MSKPLTREYLSSYVRRQLGEPLINVELDDDQLNDCIDNALDEIAPWLVQRQFARFDTASQIDLSSINPAYVIKVYKTDGATAINGTDNSLDVFDTFSTSRVISNSQNMIRRNTYARVESMLYHQIQQSLKDDVSFKYIKPYLYLDLGAPTSKGVMVEYSPSVEDVSTITNRQYQTYLKRFTLAYARLLLSDIRGKYTVSGSPVELDASTQQDKANAELEYLRQDMRTTVNTQFIID